MVVAFHAIGLNVPEAANAPGVLWLRSGVDIFFVISGFVMWVSTSGAPVSPVSFYVARIRRIVPLYWLVTGFILTVALLAPGLMRTMRFDWLHTIASLFFIPMQSPVPGSEGQMWPVIIVGWTLNMEMFFYLLFGITLLAREQARALLAIVIFIGLGGSSLFFTPNARVLAFYLSYQTAEFGLGVALGVLYTSRWPLRDVRAAALGACGGFALLVGSNFLFSFGAPLDWTLFGASGLIVTGFVGLERCGGLHASGLGTRLGDASYAIYLTHPILVSAVGQAAKRVGLMGSVAGGLAISVITILMAIAAGLVIHRFVERPIAGFLGRKPGPKPVLALP